MQRVALNWRRRGVRVALVPTMGYLHAGHTSLLRLARQAVGKTGKVIVSIYVNPAQFGPREDFSRYPRNLKRDLKLCREAGVDVVFTPSDAAMYPALGLSRCDGRTEQRAVPTSFSTYVVEERLSRSMEGASRPTHFKGVTTVVAKLFNIVLPEIAVFGQKDFQQAVIIKRMTRDLNFPVKIIVAPTVREPDGLAMSSRNKYLEGELRAQAVVLWQAIQRARLAVARARSTIPAARLKADLKRFIETPPAARLDYLEFFDPDTFIRATKVSRGVQMALAVFIGKTRLIDNAQI